jgi:putative molybdopterin biosynthesis protein
MSQLRKTIMDNELDNLLSIQETAIKLRISKPTLYRIMKKGDITSTKVSNRTFFTEKDIKEYLNKNKRTKLILH